MTGRSVVVVAPFSPGDPPVHLGAAKKIELVIGLLHRLGFKVHLVDSSHPTLAFTRAVDGRPSCIGNTPLTLWRPFCLPSRKLGKLLNVVFAEGFMRRLLAQSPAFVWVYNPYSFEARAALFLKREAATPVVLELEDLPTARRRSFNPKPWLDQRFFAPLLAATGLLTCVNAVMLKAYARSGQRSLLFPSVLQQALVDAPARARFTAATHRVGYFGGLDVEKGAAMLLAAIAQWPPGWMLVVTGVGGLTQAFADLQRAHPGRLEFHGRVSNDQVLALMHGCDAIVNPHTPITLMHQGVFPFKVCEALASGALLISTALPSIDVDLSRAVLGFDGSADDLRRALTQAPAFFADNAAAISRTRGDICARFSEATMLGLLRVEIDALLAR